MTDVTEPAAKPAYDLPDTAAGRQMAWFLAHSLTKGRDLTVEDVAAHMAFKPPGSPEEGLARFRDADDRVPRIDRIKRSEEDLIQVVLDWGDDRPSDVLMELEPAPPHRIKRI